VHPRIKLDTQNHKKIKAATNHVS